MREVLIVGLPAISKETFYLIARRYIDLGYKVKKITKEKGLYVEAVFVYTGKIDPDIYIEKRYLAQYGKDINKMKKMESEGYILCSDEWYDADETNVYVMVKESKLFLE